MPPILEFTSETAREKEWDNIAAIHAGIIQTTTWSFNQNRMGDHRLVPQQFQNKNRTNFLSETTCIVLTHCGNFVIIGYSSGDIERFNIQSGIHRTNYGSPGHKKAVRGLASQPPSSQPPNPPTEQAASIIFMTRPRRWKVVVDVDVCKSETSFSCFFVFGEDYKRSVSCFFSPTPGCGLPGPYRSSARAAQSNGNC